MKLAIVADIHHGKPHHTKRGDVALELLDQFATFVRDAAPDLILDLGDRISDENKETDLKLAREVADAFSSIDIPTYHVSGNHDRYHLSVEENAEILGQPMESKVIDAGAWQIALWRAETKITWNESWRGFTLPESDFLWLSRLVASAEKPTIVVSHVPISGYSQVGNYYFQENPDLAGYPESPRVRLALSQAHVPIISLAGHVHWNTIAQIDGIYHLTQQSLTESFTTGAPAKAWGTMELASNVHWQVLGLDPFESRFSPSSRRWTPPLKPFMRKR